MTCAVGDVESFIIREQQLHPIHVGLKIELEVDLFAEGARLSPRHASLIRYSWRFRFSKQAVFKRHARKNRLEKSEQLKYVALKKYFSDGMLSISISRYFWLFFARNIAWNVRIWDIKVDLFRKTTDTFNWETSHWVIKWYLYLF